eukprot:CAMPEP_0113605928 /NCGR_PEP_ID=MMETSP0017_2-20120614/2588_1 /TAXON_ID=2856 /ORGANISM="Cylindrotheca closterium" /LENGTH=506 /DNA_ID=CAMNT_0000514449 /DNA_START=91 /DNA_END=1611 /DNA_ORIENTATION=- /assembly_acc=CAM_ASM_000147
MLSELELPEFLINAIDAGIQHIYSYGPMAEKTVVLVPEVLSSQVGNVADAIGMDTETVSYVLGMFLCYPLGLIMLGIPYGKSRHLFSFLLGAFLLQFTLGVQWIHHLISSLVAYAMILLLPRSTLKTALPVFAVAYITLGHLHRQYINYLGWDLDFTGSQMVLTQKLYMIAFNLYDGELLAKGKEDRAAKKLAKYSLKETPGLLEFLGYTFCFSTILAGPASEYITYARACDGSAFKTPSGKPCKPPSNLIPTLKPLAISLFCLGVHLTLSPMFPLLNQTHPQTGTPFILQEEFLAQPWFFRYFHSWMGLFALREKYYFGWKNAEGAANVWYSGFDGFDEDGNSLGWESSNNINILGFELAQDLQSATKNWNIKTSFWLTRYVYMRTNGNLFAVYALSAFWHGFYPGYYMFFLSVPLPTICDRMAKKKLGPYFSKSKYTLYGIISFLATSISMNYMILPFVMLAYSWSWDAYQTNYFFGHIGCIIYYVILAMLPKPKAAGDKKKVA